MTDDEALKNYEMMTRYSRIKDYCNKYVSYDKFQNIVTLDNNVYFIEYSQNHEDRIGIPINDRETLFQVASNIYEYKDYKDLFFNKMKDMILQDGRDYFSEKELKDIQSLTLENFYGFKDESTKDKSVDVPFTYPQDRIDEITQSMQDEINDRIENGYSSKESRKREKEKKKNIRQYQRDKRYFENREKAKDSVPWSIFCGASDVVRTVGFASYTALKSTAHCITHNTNKEYYNLAYNIDEINKHNPKTQDDLNIIKKYEAELHDSKLGVQLGSAMKGKKIPMNLLYAIPALFNWGIDRLTKKTYVMGVRMRDYAAGRSDALNLNKEYYDARKSLISNEKETVIGFNVLDQQQSKEETVNKFLKEQDETKAQAIARILVTEPSSEESKRMYEIYKAVDEKSISYDTRVLTDPKYMNDLATLEVQYETLEGKEKPFIITKQNGETIASKYQGVYDNIQLEKTKANQKLNETLFSSLTDDLKESVDENSKDIVKEEFKSTVEVDNVRLSNSDIEYEM